MCTVGLQLLDLKTKFGLSYLVEELQPTKIPNPQPSTKKKKETKPSFGNEKSPVDRRESKKKEDGEKKKTKEK